MNKKFLSNINLSISFIVIVLFFGLLSCSSSKKEEEECVYNHPRNCEEWISQEVFKRGSNLPSDGIILLENWTFFLTYFNNKTSKISNEYVIVDCNCEIVYFGNDDPRIKNSIN